MRPNKFKTLMKALGVFLTSTALYGCTSESSSPVRNKYPEYFSSAGGFESFQSQDAQRLASQQDNLLTSNVTYQFAGGMRSSIAVGLPDILEDSLAIKLIQTYRPFAIPLLAQWARANNNKGMVVDLRSDNNTDVMRTEYIIERQNSFSIPLAFIYDKYSAQRAFGYMSMLKEFPEVQCRKVSGN